MERCEYFKGRQGQCGERAEHCVTSRIVYVDFVESKTSKYTELLRLCDAHLTWWFDDQETIERKTSEVQQCKALPDFRKPYKNPPDPALVARDKAIRTAILELRAAHGGRLLLKDLRTVAQRFGVQWWTVRDCARNRKKTLWFEENS